VYSLPFRIIFCTRSAFNSTCLHLPPTHLTHRGGVACIQHALPHHFLQQNAFISTCLHLPPTHLTHRGGVACIQHALPHHLLQQKRVQFHLPAPTPHPFDTPWRRSLCSACPSASSSATEAHFIPPACTYSPPT